MSKNYKDITLKVFDEVFKDDCYDFRYSYGKPNQTVVTVFGWEFFWCCLDDDAFIVYDSYLEVQYWLEYSDTYEEDLSYLLLDHVIPYNINEFEIQDELNMYYALKNKGLIEFTHSDVSIIPNTEIYYVWDDTYLTIECCDRTLITIYGKNPFPTMRFIYSDIDEAILYVEAVNKFLMGNKEVLDSYSRFDDSIKQVIQDVTKDVQCKLQDDFDYLEDIIKLYERG